MPTYVAEFLLGRYCASFTMIPDGIEQFVSTPELHSENSIGTDSLPAGQIWALSPGGPDENSGLFRIEVTEGPGSGVRITCYDRHYIHDPVHSESGLVQPTRAGGVRGILRPDEECLWTERIDLRNFSVGKRLT